MESEPAVSPTVKKSKPKAPPSAEKQLGELVKLLFLSPFVRRLRYLYFRLYPDHEHLYVLGSVEEQKLRFADPDQSVGFVQILDPEQQTIIHNWLTTFFKHSHCLIVDLHALTQICSNAKWKCDAIQIEDDSQGRVFAKFDDLEKVIALPLLSVFTASKLQRCTEDFVHSLKQPPLFEYPFQSELSDMLLRVVITPEAYQHTVLGEQFPHGIPLLVTKGVDLLDHKPWTTPPDFFGYCFWGYAEGHAIYFLHMARTSQYIIAQTRCNLFLISPKQTQPSNVGLINV